MNPLYPTPASFDRAIKKAVKQSGREPGEGYRQALRDRFLCRVFAGGNEKFILKGGGGLLARIPDARATRDLDFAICEKISVEESLAEMNRVAAIDLDDWCRFVLTKHEESMDENGYSRLLKLRFAAFVGVEEKDPVLIDLSLDCAPTMPPERVAPANRIGVVGVEECDYLIYPLADQLADKFCAIMELRPSGYPSSRMKDLVDVVTYATHETVRHSELHRAIMCECTKRGMDVPEHFAAPNTWRTHFADFAKGKLPTEYANFDAASKLAERFFNTVLLSSDRGAVWDPATTSWVIDENSRR